jgi:sulfate adenylyltransferase subunit 2
MTGQSVQAWDAEVLRAAQDPVAAGCVGRRATTPPLAGAARRGEIHAKERIYSFRDGFGQWDPKNQRPELWNLFNSRVDKGESIRVFPLSNWTELDVWQYIHLENIPIVPMYFAKMREMVVRGSTLIPVGKISLAGRKTGDGDVPDAFARMQSVYRRDSFKPIPCQDRGRNDAGTTLGRENRVIDHDQEGSMESKARGYF